MLEVITATLLFENVSGNEMTNLILISFGLLALLVSLVKVWK